jgi:hypothetical protein
MISDTSYASSTIAESDMESVHAPDSLEALVR